MPGTLYPNAAPRALSDKLGERYSVLDAGAVGDGTTDNAAAFARAVAAAITAGGCTIYIPKGRYVLNTPVVLGSGVSGISFVGDGANTVLLRGATLPASKGLIDVSGSDIQFHRLVVDGQVTTAAGLQYGTFSDPMDARLTSNTSFWIHGGSKRIRFTDVKVQHSGGYAILLDATNTGDIADIRVLDCTFENNRPHLFGPVGDLNYGSWTGGIHYQGDGSTYAVKNLVVRHCTFRRNTGNCVWGHAYAFAYPHSNIEVSGCYFEDCGLDGVESGCLSSGVVENNRFRRMGYICLNDTAASVPKFLSTAYACAIDTSGLVRGVNYQNNTFMSINGGCMDLDGFCEGTVSGNTCIIPAAGEPEYAQDSIATFGNGNAGLNWVYGCQPSNTSNTSLGASNITVSGNTFINMGGGAIRMFAARNCTVQGNTIIHPAAANYPAISLGNIGTGPYQQATGNVVTDNSISWTPASIRPAIFEDATYGAFTSADKNWVAGNRLQGNCFEFQKDPNSASSTAVVASSGAASLAVRSENVVQRESVGATAVYRNYQSTAAGMTAFSSLFDELSNSLGTAVGGPLFNVSNNGGAGTGSFSTAGRTTAVFDDALLTGKVWGDSFLALTDTTYVAAQANLLPASVGLLRYNSSTGQFLTSVSVSSGARVWVALGGGASIPSWVTMVDSGAARNVQIAGVASDPGIFTLLASNGTDYADWTYNGSDADFDVSTGGINLRPLSSSGAVRVWNPANSVKLRVGSAGFSAALDLFHDGTNGNITWTAGLLNLGSNAQLDNTGNLGIGAVLTANGGVNTGSSATNAIQAPSGGMLAKYLIGTVSLTLSATTTATAGAQAGRMIFDGTHFKFCPDGVNWYDPLASASGFVTAVNTFTGGITLSGTANQVLVANSAGTVTFSLPQSISTASSVTFGNVTVAGVFQSTGSGATITFQNSSGNFQVDGNGNISGGGTANLVGGYLINGVASFRRSGASLQWSTDGSTWNTFSGNVVSSLNGFTGGITLSGGTGISVSSLTITNTGVTAVYSGTGISVNANTGGLTVTNTGVTSLGGYTGSCSLSGGTGVSTSGLTISIGQAVGTGSAVSFYSVTTSAGMQINQSGGYGLYLPNSYVYANGFNSFNSSWNGIQSSGGVSAYLGFYMSSGSQVINNSGAFVGAGVSCPSYGVQASGFNPTGYTGQSYTLYFPSGFQVSGSTYYNVHFIGGVFVSLS